MSDDLSHSSGVAERLGRVLEAIDEAASRAGRPGGVRLVAVSKTMPVERIREAYEAGQTTFGENRVQEGVEKAAALRDAAPDITWHLIGHLQTNKARPAVESFDLIESIDSLRLATKLDELAARMGRSLPVLFEVNVAGEVTKGGFSPDDLRHSWEQLMDLSHLVPRGLMTVAPAADDPEEVRPVFRRLRLLRDELGDRSDLPAFTELSMGMSGDYMAAIEEGATLVRIGRAIFGPRTAQ